MRYKNKNGISLNYSSDDIHTKLVKEVIVEAITILENNKVDDAMNFLIENFDIKTVGDYTDEI